MNTTKSNHRVLIVDKDEIRRAGIVRILDLMVEDFVIDEADGLHSPVHGNENIRKYDLILLLEIESKDREINEIRNICSQFSDSAIIVSVPFCGSASNILRAIASGVASVIPENCSIEEMQEIIRQVLRGMVIFPRRLLALEENAFFKEPSFVDSGVLGMSDVDIPYGQLTKRQTAVLGLLVQGKSNHEIAEELGISENTVRVHLSAILKTLKASNRTQAAIIASTYLRNRKLIES